MKRISIAIILFLLQLYVLLRGATHFHKLLNPFILFSISALIAANYLYTLLHKPKDGKTIQRLSVKTLFIGGAIGLVSIGLLYGSYRTAFDLYSDYAGQSDVIPQLETLFLRFSNGVFPYAPLEQYPWHPYPVYMPLNWLPVGLAGPLKCDVRWIGVLFLGFSAVAWGIYAWARGSNSAAKLIAVILPAGAAFAFLRWNEVSMGITLETLIAAYYLLLATGLAARNLVMITAGIILCLLSRYTMVFWLPLFFFLLWPTVSRKKNLLVWFSVIASVLVLYLLPFFFQDASILTKGIAYHNQCYVDAWDGLGHPEESTAFDEGLNFSWFIREAAIGTMAQKVLTGRIIQATIMLLLTIGGIIGYRKVKDRIAFYDYSLLMLYVILLCFFMFSPLTYMYYYLPLMMVSAVLCGRMILTGKN
jgi:hypothetical protein